MTEQQRRSICMAVAKALRTERERRGLSMTAVAERAGLSQQMVSYVERGMRVPTLDTLLRIAGSIDLDLSGVLKRAMKVRR